VDLYRIHDPRELKELGWEELCAGEEILLVEWPERAGGQLPADRWEVELRAPEGTSELREVMVLKVGSPPSLPSFPMALSPDLG
jgi:tRNA A37 threonylcarbamoyladenosine biosynthesis protein TsaE